MTRRRNRRHRNTAQLKVMLLAASFFATLGGAQLLALQESMASAGNTKQSGVDEPETVLPVDSLTGPNRRTTFELKPIPQAIVPRINPVARARSSM